MTRRELISWVVAIAAFSAVAVGGYRLFERQWWLSKMPPNLGVDRVLYSASDSWGFGPGGNETGVALYELPQDVAVSIIAGGIDHVLGVDGSRLTWNDTPLTGPSEWFEGEGALPQTGPVPVPRLHNYLNQYGFGIPVDPAVTSLIDRALSEPGNKFAFTRTGVLLVMPKVGRVAYAYAG